MYRKILTLAKHSAIYGLGSVGPRVIGFLLIPVFTRFMSPADYGVLALCMTTAGMLKIFSLAGIPSAMFRSYIHVARTDDERRQVQATAFFALLVVGLGVLALCVGLREVLARWIFGSAEQADFIVMIAMVNFFGIVHAYRNATFRIHDQSTRFAAFTFVHFAVGLALSLALVVGLRQGAWGAMTANVLAMMIMALMFLPWCIARLGGGYSGRALREMLEFGVPLIPFGVAVWVMNLSDIYILRIFSEPAEVGIYTLGYRFGLGVYILTNALKTAYPKVIFTEGRSDQAPALFARVVTYYAVGVGFFCLGVSVFAPQLILMADSRFHAAWAIIPLVVWGYFFHGVVPILQVGFDLRNKTRYLAVIYMGAAVVNVALNLIFVPRFGMMGAAVTTLVTFALLPVPVYVISARLYPLHLEWGRLGRVVLVLGALGGVVVLLPFESMLALSAAKAGLCLAVAPALYLTGFFTSEELGKLRRLRRSR